MLTNTDVTIFHRVYDQKTRLDSWKMTYISEAWWFKKEQSTITTDGRKNADVYTIRIPNTNIVLEKDDYIVKGICRVKMRTVKDLEGLEKVRITSVNYNTFGGNPHIKAVGV